MKLPHKVNPAHCCSKDGTRYIINGMGVRDGFAAATDGRVLFVAKAELETDDADREAIIPKRAVLKAFAKSKKTKSVIPSLMINPAKEGELKTVTVMDKHFDKTTVQEINPGKSQFPRWECVCLDPEPYTRRISFTFSLLKNIVNAFNSDEITFHINPNAVDDYGSNTAAIYITSENSQEAFAMLMPRRETSLPISKHPLVIKAVAKAGIAKNTLQPPTP